MSVFQLDGFMLQQCDIQGRLFEYSLGQGADSKDFIEKFMLSDTAKHLDLSYDRLQWAGEEYIFSNLAVEEGIELQSTGNYYDKEVMYWAGYVYRYWHYYTNYKTKKRKKDDHYKKTAMQRNTGDGKYSVCAVSLHRYLGQSRSCQ